MGYTYSSLRSSLSFSSDWTPGYDIPNRNITSHSPIINFTESYNCYPAVRSKLTDIVMEGGNQPFNSRTDSPTPSYDHDHPVASKWNDANYEGDIPPTLPADPPTPPQDRDFPALPGIAVGYRNAGSTSPASSVKASTTKIPVRSESRKKFPLYANLLPKLQFQI